MYDAIDWSDSPPPLPCAKVWTPPAGLSYVCLLDRWHGLYLHWCGKRSMPCLGEKRCPSSRHHRPCRWSGYAPAAVAKISPGEKGEIKQWEKVVLSLGVEHATILSGSLKHFDNRPLLKINREKGSRAWTVEWPGRTLKSDGLPAPFDVRPTLYRLWGVRPKGSYENGEEDFS